MRVFNQDNIELTEYDLTKGKLVPETLTILVPKVEGQKQEDYVIDGVYTVVKPFIAEVPEHTEIEPIYRYIPYTDEELSEIEEQKEKETQRAELLEEKEELLSWLKEHDYIGIKIATGRATVEEYQFEISEMTAYAKRINEIEAELEGDVE